jgi:DNA-binding transcriptional LysR family regulator
MNNVGLIRKMAELGMGVAVSAGAETGADFAAGQLRRVLPDWRCAPIPVYAMLESRLIPSRVRLFIEHMAAALAAFA